MTSVKELCCWPDPAHLMVIIQTCVNDSEISPYQEFNDFSSVPSGFDLQNDPLRNDFLHHLLINICSASECWSFLIDLSTNRIIFSQSNQGLNLSLKCKPWRSTLCFQIQLSNQSYIVPGNQICDCLCNSEYHAAPKKLKYV